MDIDLSNIDFNQIWKQFLYDPQAPMMFNTGFFMWWFVCLMIIYQFLHNKQTVKVIYLFFCSLYFYYKSSGFYFILLIISTLIDFWAAQFIYKSQKKSSKRFFLILSLISNLGMLAYFKYTNFFIETYNNFVTNKLEFEDIFLPAGISFYTFQTLSYTIDVYRGNLKPINNILDFGFFVSYFPQLVAGPIVRAKDFLPQIRKQTFISKEHLGRAVYLISSGLFKKAVISDYISINFVDRIFDNPTLYSGFENLMGVYGYAIQIYCDFSGYSDVAIGLALLMGFRLPINFDSPYQSSSITEFWRRWHISLSSWLKDYLYIPLGGNRKGKIRQYINLMITMLLGGLWHGASWKFVFWGGMHGLALAIEKFFKNIFTFKKTFITKIIGILLTFHFVCFLWIFFRADSFDSAINVLSQIIYHFSSDVIPDVISAYKYVFSLILLGFILHFIPQKIELKTQNIITNSPLIVKSLIIIIVIWLITQVKSSEIQPYIYFQF